MQARVSFDQLNLMKCQLAIASQLAEGVLEVAKSENHSPCCSGAIVGGQVAPNFCVCEMQGLSKLAKLFNTAKMIQEAGEQGHE
jgi:hypothetical protein